MRAFKQAVACIKPRTYFRTYALPTNYKEFEIYV